MVRRISEREAEARQRGKPAKKDAVSKLPVVKIEKKHCKTIGSQQEPPMCTVCCEHIVIGSKGMFMPCGHVYHPDCLTPWLEKNNSCPVCRFELPLESK
jgi:E3 ubiquitin-protein ligase RNF115/126